MKRLLLALIVIAARPLFACTPAIAITPARPFVHDEIEIAMHGVCGCSAVPQNPRVTVTGREIDVDLEQFTGGCLTVITEWGERVQVKGLTPGKYDVVVRSNGRELTRTSLTVGASDFRMTPAFGDAGTEVLLESEKFFCDAGITPPCEAPQVTFGGVPAVIKSADHTSLTVIAPEHAPGVVDVVVNGAFKASGFLYPAIGADLTAEHELVLFPLAFEGAGAFGTRWTTENVVRSDAPIAMKSLGAEYPARSTKRLPVTGEDGGMFLYVPRGFERWLSYSSHFVDRSRRDVDAGTEMRVVFDGDTGPILRILNVPLTTESRQTLRVYDFDAVPNRVVNVNVTSDRGATYSTNVTMSHFIVCVAAPCYPPYPTFGVVSLDAIPQLRGAGSATVSINQVALTRRDLRLWAFVSVTNNETQHVTTYTPQHTRRTTPF